jgi:hypothetical protein
MRIKGEEDDTFVKKNVKCLMKNWPIYIYIYILDFLKKLPIFNLFYVEDSINFVLLVFFFLKSSYMLVVIKEGNNSYLQMVIIRKL